MAVQKSENLAKKSYVLLQWKKTRPKDRWQGAEKTGVTWLQCFWDGGRGLSRGGGRAPDSSGRRGEVTCSTGCCGWDLATEHWEDFDLAQVNCTAPSWGLTAWQTGGSHIDSTGPRPATLLIVVSNFRKDAKMSRNKGKKRRWTPLPKRKKKTKNKNTHRICSGKSPSL